MGEIILNSNSLEKKLYDAAATNDTTSLHRLLEIDPLLLERVSFTSPNKTTPLHIATMNGHLKFVKQILTHNPDHSEMLAKVLDSQQTSPLHIASANGKLELVKILLSVAPDMCMSRDCQGRNPLHVAVMKGHVEVLAELVSKAPLAARQKVDGDQTVLHLCVKHDRLEALKILLPCLKEGIDAKDDYGDTILHMAVADTNTQIIHYLAESTNIDLNVKNSNGQTAMNILEQTQLDEYLRIKRNRCLRHCNSKTRTEKLQWLTNKGDVIMLVAIFIATVAFQAGVSPAGGIWQESLTEDSHPNPHKAGEAVMAHTHPEEYKNFIRFNTVAFVSSVATILMLMIGLPIKNKIFMWMLIIIMWLTVTSLSASFAISILVVTPREVDKSMPRVVIGLIGLCVSIPVVLGIKRLKKWLKERKIRICPYLAWKNSIPPCYV